ncbi:MAG: hypothetical protein MUO82_04455 [Candidatus Thermoplasmatota archaeon]|nr:hypothetical protein [Candidatus Thermoplasmatota archaeon]
MKRRGVIVCLALAVFALLTLPSISAVESNTVLNLKKSFSNKTPELIKEQINDMLFPKLNISILITISILLDIIAYRLITQNYTEIAVLILLTNLFLIIRFIYKHGLNPISPFLECHESVENLFIQ